MNSPVAVQKRRGVACADALAIRGFARTRRACLVVFRAANSSLRHAPKCQNRYPSPSGRSVALKQNRPLRHFSAGRSDAGGAAGRQNHIDPPRQSVMSVPGAPKPRVIGGIWICTGNSFFSQQHFRLSGSAPVTTIRISRTLSWARPSAARRAKSSRTANASRARWSGALRAPCPTASDAKSAAAPVAQRRFRAVRCTRRAVRSFAASRRAGTGEGRCSRRS